ncbi:MAG: CTP synthase [Chloroflexi bacterium]|nr:CTP synthase [Chloroflexota bacterium]
MTTKYIFVTGGVVSSIGKGICVASIGRLLKSRGLSVSVAKLDPYLNVDPGTMSPYQHGEVFVTRDGGETDLDLGHYERFIDVELTRSSNLTAGQVYMTLIARERRGDFLGGTIQTVPHVTNEIKARLTELASESQVDVLVVEVGGTVGDIEGLPFLEAIRQMRKDVGRNNVCYVHLTLLPYISGAEELKTKPTQHSVKELRGIGIQPDALICRSDNPISDSIRDKLSLFCDVDGEAVIPLETVANVYEVPLILERAGLGDFLVNLLSLQGQPQDLSEWTQMVERMRRPSGKLPIAIVGKYVEYPDSYLSVREALRHAGTAYDQDVEIKWVHSEDIERHGPDAYLADVMGIVVPGGFGPRGVEGMIDTVQYARENGIPYLGLCLGLQVMIIDWARHILGLDGANSSELDPETPHPVIHIMPEQEAITDLGGTMRLGGYPCRPQQNTLTFSTYGKQEIEERHRHRFEVNNLYRECLEESGMIMGGLSPDGKLVETAEVAEHPFMVGVQFHPEFQSRPNRPHPLFCQFIAHSLNVIREGNQQPLPLETR